MVSLSSHKTGSLFSSIFDEVMLYLLVNGGVWKRLEYCRLLPDQRNLIPGAVWVKLGLLRFVGGIFGVA